MKKLTTILLAFLLILSTAPVTMAAGLLGATTERTRPTLHGSDSSESASTPTVERYSSIIDEESSHYPGTGAEAPEESTPKNADGQTKKPSASDVSNVISKGTGATPSQEVLSGNGTTSSAKDNVTVKRDQVTADHVDATDGGDAQQGDASSKDATSGGNGSKEDATSKQSNASKAGATAEQGSGAKDNATVPGKGASNDATSEKGNASDDRASSKQGNASDDDASSKQGNASNDDASSKQGNASDDDASSKQGNASDDDASSKQGNASDDDASSKQGNASDDDTSSKQGNASDDDASSKQGNASDDDASSKQGNASDDDASSKQGNASDDDASSKQGNASDDDASSKSTPSDLLKNAAHNENVREEDNQPEKSRLDQLIEKKGILPKVSYLFTEFGKWLEDLVDEVM